MRKKRGETETEIDTKRDCLSIEATRVGLGQSPSGFAAGSSNLEQFSNSIMQSGFSIFLARNDSCTMKFFIKNCEAHQVGESTGASHLICSTISWKPQTQTVEMEPWNFK